MISSAYSYIEPVGVTILKAIKQESPEIEIKLPNKDAPCFSYIKTLNEAHYDESKTYIPIEIVDNKNANKNKEKITSKIMNNFNHLGDDDKEDLRKYLDYMVREILNNAIQHSLSPIGAVIVGQYFPKQKKLQICVVDKGIGFLSNLKLRYDVKTEQEAILKALEKGVSSPPAKLNPYYSGEDNAGYGLYALKTMIEKTNGKLLIISNNGVVRFDEQGKSMQSISKNWKGSIVVFEFFENEINFSIDDFFRIFIWDQDEEVF